RGVTEPSADPARVVDVEKLSVRYQADHIWLISEHAREDRYLSCSLNLTWPAPGLPTPPAAIPDHSRILHDLEAAFHSVAATTRAGEARSAVVDDRFTGWPSYPARAPAAAALQAPPAAPPPVRAAAHPWTPRPG